MGDPRSQPAQDSHCGCQCTLQSTMSSPQAEGSSTESTYKDKVMPYRGHSLPLFLEKGSQEASRDEEDLPLLPLKREGTRGYRYGQEKMITSASYSLVLKAGSLVTHMVLKAEKCNCSDFCETQRPSASPCQIFSCSTPYLALQGAYLGLAEGPRLMLSVGVEG